MTLKILIILCVMIITLSCDTDRFFGSNYGARTVAQTLLVEGRIQNVFTNEPVDLASISLNNQTALTNIAGEFTMDYVISGDEQFAAPVPLVIRADKYLPISTTAILQPNDNRLNFSLEYGAPIVNESSKSGNVVTATVFDYQGVDNLLSVNVSANFHDGLNRRNREFFFMMTRDRVVDGQTAIYSGTLDPLIMVDGVTWGLQATFYFINAKDLDGLEDRFRFQNF